MTASGQPSTDEELLRNLVIQLRLWAIEARSGGWSRQHVDPMRAQAGRIEDHLGLKHASPLLEMIEDQERSPDEPESQGSIDPAQALLDGRDADPPTQLEVQGAKLYATGAAGYWVITGAGGGEVLLTQDQARAIGPVMGRCSSEHAEPPGLRKGEERVDAPAGGVFIRPDLVKRWLLNQARVIADEVAEAPADADSVSLAAVLRWLKEHTNFVASFDLQKAYDDGELS